MIVIVLVLITSCSYIHVYYVQQVHRVSESTSDIACTKSPAYEAVSNKRPVYDYVLVNDIQPKSSSGGSDHTELGPRPVPAPPVRPEVGRKVSYSDVKHTVSYASNCMYCTCNFCSDIVLIK